MYDNLTKPFDTDCMMGGVSAARVCKAKPDESLLVPETRAAWLTMEASNRGTEIRSS